MDQANDTFDAVVKMFASYDCQEETLISKPKLTQIFNKQANINLHHNFSITILEEIWGQAETTSRGQSTVHTFAQIYSRAIKILQDRIGVIDGPTGLLQKQRQLESQRLKLKQLQGQYYSGLDTNSDKINVVRKNIVVIENKIKQLQQNKSDFEKDLKEMRGCLHVEDKSRVIQKSQYVVQSRMSQSMSPPAPSPHLSLIFKVTVIGILFQILFLHFHESFLGLLCYFFIIFWLFIGYYDQYFVKAIIVGLVLSSALDFTYICLQLVGKIGKQRYHSKQNGWIIASIVFLAIEIAMRILLIIKLCMFRQPNAKRQYFILSDREIQLNTRSGKIFNND